MNTGDKVQKIFVDTDEEIAFTIEHIVANPAGRVVLVIPQNAVLTSSAVSLKILSRQLIVSDKQVILVTDDKIGALLGAKAGLLVLPKISDVAKEAWMEAKRMKDRLISEKNHIKHELLDERKIKDDEHVVSVEKPIDKNISPAASVEKPMGDDINPAESTEDLPESDENLISEKSETGAEEPAEKMIKAHVEEIPATMSDKPRLPSKMVEINGIRLVAGGDVLDHEDEIQGNNVFDDEFEEKESKGDKKINISSETLKSFASSPDEDDADNGTGKLIGRDFGRIVPSRATVSSRLQKTHKKVDLSKIKEKFGFLNKYFKFLTKGNNGIQILKIGIVLLIIFFIVSYIFFPAVAVNLTFSEEEVRVNELVKASTKIEEIDLENLNLPAFKISKTSTGSGDAKSTGKGSTGVVAKGIVDFYNKTDNDITVAKGKVITNINSQLKYVTTKQVVVPKDSNIFDVPVEATVFGENYNITGSNASFQVEGYTTDQLNAVAVRDITGGTTVETIAVSKQDLDALKASIEDGLKKDLINKLKTLLSNEDTLLEGSEKFETTKYEPSAKEGDSVEDFTANIEMSVSALKVTQSDLKAIAKELVRLKQGSSEAAQIDLANIEIRNIVIKDDEASFNVNFNANVQEDTDIENIKEAIKGKKVSDAREYLKSIDGVKEYRLKYTPSYIPLFLQIVPNDVGKIEIVKSSN